MGRPSKGYKVRWPTNGHSPSVRFSHQGKPYNLGLGTRDREAAGREAARLYAGVVSGTIVYEQPIEIEVGRKTTEVGSEWLDQRGARLRENTRETYEGYIVQLARRMPRIEQFTTENLEAYASDRLCQVQKSTLRHELSAAKMICKFAHGKKYLRVRPSMPEIERSEKGTPYQVLKNGDWVTVRRRVKADALSRQEVEALLAELPEWSRKRQGQPAHPIRARFVFAYEMALRPELVDKLSVPLHWQPGAREIYIPARDDKTKKERPLPLTDRAIAALESVAPATGLIFGHHDYRERLLTAAKAAKWPDYKAERFCGQHFRSAGGTHLLELSKSNLQGVQAIMGHAKASTTAGYMRESEQQTAKVIAIASRRRR
jgi:integrase